MFTEEVASEVALEGIHVVEKAEGWKGRDARRALEIGAQHIQR